MKIKQTQVKAIREEKLAAQNGKCSLCGLVCTGDEAVLDHDHSTGLLRGVLHRGCNSLLGPIENRWKRYAVKDLMAFAHGIGQYLQTHHDDPTTIRHYTHMTQVEKEAKMHRVKEKLKATKAKEKALKKPKI